MLATDYSFEEVCDLVRDHYNNMEEITDSNRRKQIRTWIERAEQHGDNEAKQNLVADLKVYLYSKNIELNRTHQIYPGVPTYECVIFRTYGLGIYDAIINRSPSIESVLLATGQIARYVEHGITKNFEEYLPNDQEMEALQDKLSQICRRQLNKTNPVVSGYIESTETRIQMYMPPYSYSRTVITRRFTTSSFSLDDLKMDKRAKEFYKQAVKGRLNLIFGGGMGTGKTTRQICLLKCKDPQTEIVTTWESEHEMRLEKKWSGFVTALQSLDEIDLGFQGSHRHIFRNNSQTIVFAEVREEMEAHYSLLSCLRGTDSTYMTIHLRTPTPEAGIRTYASLINQFRRGNVSDVYRDIADGIDVFCILENYSGNRVDYCIFVPEFTEGYVTGAGQYVSGEPRARVLAYYDVSEPCEENRLKWTGNVLPDHKIDYMIYKGTADLDILRTELKITDRKRMF